MRSFSKERKPQLPVLIDYKSPLTLFPFIGEGGKISPARINGLEFAQQKKLKKAIKKARSLSLLPSCSSAYDNLGALEQISAVPFELDETPSEQT